MNQRMRMARKRWSVAKEREEKRYSAARAGTECWGAWQRRYARLKNATANLRLLTGEVLP